MTEEYTNHLIALGNPNAIEDIYSCANNDHSEFQFSIIHPVPEVLEIINDTDYTIDIVNDKNFTATTGYNPKTIDDYVNIICSVPDTLSPTHPLFTTISETIIRLIVDKYGTINVNRWKKLNWGGLDHGQNCQVHCHDDNIITVTYTTEYEYQNKFIRSICDRYAPDSLNIIHTSAPEGEPIEGEAIIDSITSPTLSYDEAYNCFIHYFHTIEESQYTHDYDSPFTIVSEAYPNYNMLKYMKRNHCYQGLPNKYATQS